MMLQVPVNGGSVVADYDLKLGNIDVDLDGLGPLQVDNKHYQKLLLNYYYYYYFCF